MALKNQDLTVLQGEDFVLELTITDQDGNVVDLTGRSFKGAVASAVGQPIDASFVYQPQDQTARRGIARLVLEGAVSAKLPVPRQKAAVRDLVQFLYDIQMSYPVQDPQPSPRRVAQGVLNLSPSITK